jgi:hypothetical protein
MCPQSVVGDVVNIFIAEKVQPLFYNDFSDIITAPEGCGRVDRSRHVAVSSLVLIGVPPALTFVKFTFRPQSVLVLFFKELREQAEIISL